MLSTMPDAQWTLTSFLPFCEDSGNLIHALDQLKIGWWGGNPCLFFFFLVKMFRRKMALCSELYWNFKTYSFKCWYKVLLRFAEDIMQILFSYHYPCQWNECIFLIGIFCNYKQWGNNSCWLYEIAYKFLHTCERNHLKSKAAKRSN